MATKNKNPYRQGSAYATIFEYIRKHQIVSREELLSAGFAPADIIVVTSPRPEGKCKGDCRGNYSAQGHLYAMTPLKKDTPQRYRLVWRKVPLDKRVRPNNSKD